MISQVTVEVFTLYVLEVLSLHVGEGVVLEISVDFVDFGFELGNLLCGGLFWESDERSFWESYERSFWEWDERSGGHDFRRAMEFLFALKLTLLFNKMFFN